MSVVQVMGGRSGGSLAVDSTPFYGAKLPDEVKRSGALLKKLDQEVFKKILKLVVQYLELGVADEEAFLSLASDKLPEASVRVLFAAILLLLRAALRQPSMKSEVFVADLNQIKYPEQVIIDLNAVFSSRRTVLDRCLTDRRVRLPRLVSFRWRVDVTISNSSLHRVLEPSVFMEMKLSDGSIKTFEVPASKFHELRYSVTSVLKEMQDLEKRNIMKLKN